MSGQVELVSSMRTQQLHDDGVYRHFDVTVTVRGCDTAADALLAAWKERAVALGNGDQIAVDVWDQTFTPESETAFFGIVVGFPNPLPEHFFPLEDDLTEKRHLFSQVFSDPMCQDENIVRSADGEGAQPDYPTEAELWVYSREDVRDADFGRVSGHPWVTGVGRVQVQVVWVAGEEAPIPDSMQAYVAEQRALMAEEAAG